MKATFCCYSSAKESPIHNSSFQWVPSNMVPREMRNDKFCSAFGNRVQGRSFPVTTYRLRCRRGRARYTNRGGFFERQRGCSRRLGTNTTRSGTRNVQERRNKINENARKTNGKEQFVPMTFERNRQFYQQRLNFDGNCLVSSSVIIKIDWEKLRRTISLVFVRKRCSPDKRTLISASQENESINSYDTRVIFSLKNDSWLALRPCPRKG